MLPIEDGGPGLTAQGPGAEALGHVQDGTDVHDAVRAAMLGD